MKVRKKKKYLFHFILLMTTEIVKTKAAGMESRIYRRYLFGFIPLTKLVVCDVKD